VGLLHVRRNPQTTPPFNSLAAVAIDRHAHSANLH
jgi:hypothetical protein